MNPIIFYPSGQIPTEHLTSFSECMKNNDYLSAYRNVAITVSEDKEEFMSALIETLVDSDLYDEVLEILTQIEHESEKLAFLFNIASEYLKRGKYNRVYDLYGLLDVSFRFSLATKMLVNEHNEDKKLAIIDNIIYLHKINDDIAGAICFAVRLTIVDPESVLFKLGLDLIHERRWKDCHLIKKALISKSEVFQIMVVQARHNALKEARIRV